MQMETHIQKNDPYSLFPHYREIFSGTYEKDKPVYRMAYPSSIYPVLNLGYPIYDNIGNRLEPGHYEVALSTDKKFLLLIQSKKLVAKVPVIEVDFDEQSYEEQRTKMKELYEKLEKYRIKRNRKRINQFEQEIAYQNKKILAQNRAEIDNSNSEYFILDYHCNFASATGYIKRASQDWY